MKKKFLYGIMLIITILLSIQAISFATETDEIKVKMNGKYLKFDQPPVMINDRVMVPIRRIFEEAGCTVSWDESKGIATAQLIPPEQGTVTYEPYLTHIQLVENSNLIRAIHCINGKYSYRETEMEVDTQRVNDRLLVPARYVANSVGYYVTWSEEEQTVYIDKPYVTAYGDRYGDSGVPNINVALEDDIVPDNVRITTNGVMTYTYSFSDYYIAQSAYVDYYNHLIITGWACDKEVMDTLFKEFKTDPLEEYFSIVKNNTVYTFELYTRKTSDARPYLMNISVLTSPKPMS